MNSSAKQVFTGACQCGAVRYRVTGTPINYFICHCTQCQRQSASAFGMALWVRDFALEIAQGELSEYPRETPSGQTITGSFCATCGTRLFHQQSRNSAMISIKPGTLNSAPAHAPVAHIWTDDALPWSVIPDDVLSYPGNPPDFNEMLARFAAQAPPA